MPARLGTLLLGALVLHQQLADSGRRLVVVGLHLLVQQHHQETRRVCLSALGASAIGFLGGFDELRLDLLALGDQFFPLLLDVGTAGLRRPCDT